MSTIPSPQVELQMLFAPGDARHAQPVSTWHSKQPSPEWFVVDLFQHAEQAGADRDDLTRALGATLRRGRFDADRLRRCAQEYGSRDTQRRVEEALDAARVAAA